MKEKITPYDTGKIKIGVYYQPPRFPMEDHELMLQNVLLHDSTFVEYKEPWYRRIPSWLLVCAGAVAYIVLLGSI